MIEIPFEQLDSFLFSIANREKRNATDFYQQKHIFGTQSTKDRKPYLNALNWEIPEHFKNNLGIYDVFGCKDIFYAIGVGDCTANLFRPSYDINKTPPLFFLKGEPLDSKEYYSFIVEKIDMRFKIRISKIRFIKGIPYEKGNSIPNLSWLFCSTPLIYESKPVDPYEMALNNYDIRHLYGKKDYTITDKIYLQSKSATGEFNYKGFVSGIIGSRNLLKPIGPEVEWYHAGIGIREGKILVIHNRGSLYDLALIFETMSVESAVLLDSGGSPVIWTNQNGKGAIEYNPLYHREKRGAIIIVKMKNLQ